MRCLEGPSNIPVFREDLNGCCRTANIQLKSKCIPGRRWSTDIPESKEQNMHDTALREWLSREQGFTCYCYLHHLLEQKWGPTGGRLDILSWVKKERWKKEAGEEGMAGREKEGKMPSVLEVQPQIRKEGSEREKDRQRDWDRGSHRETEQPSPFKQQLQLIHRRHSRHAS